MQSYERGCFYDHIYVFGFFFCHKITDETTRLKSLRNIDVKGSEVGGKDLVKIITLGCIHSLVCCSLKILLKYTKIRPSMILTTTTLIRAMKSIVMMHNDGNKSTTTTASCGHKLR